MNRRMLLQTASLPEVRSMRASRQNPILESLTKYYDWAYLAFTIDLRGQNVGRSDGGDKKFYGDRDYFRQVTEGERFGKQVLIGKTSGKPALILSTGIFDAAGRLQGVLALAMTLEALSGDIVNATVGTSGFSFLLDERGEVIAHPNDAFTQSRVDMSNHQALSASANGESLVQYSDYDGQQVVAVAQKTRQGWTMVTQQNHAEAYRLIKEENFKATILLLATLVAVVLVAIIVSRRLTAPLRDLTQVADQYSQGQLDLPISGLDRGDEIGQLAQAIERLGTSIQLAMERLRRK